jgi:acetyl esterase/lipase
MSDIHTWTGLRLPGRGLPVRPTIDGPRAGATTEEPEIIANADTALRPGQALGPEGVQLDADSRALMKLQPRRPGFPETLADVKEQYRRWRLLTQPELPQVDRVKEYMAAGPHGPIPIRVYRGAGTADLGILPVHVSYHGGGWMLGDLDSHDWICRAIANAAYCAVVNVEYRLAPDYIFPVAFDDALAALRWVVANASLLRIAPGRVSLGGDGAGGNLAAAVALALRNEGRLGLKALTLLYPAVDLSLSGSDDGHFSEDVLTTADALRGFIERYVPKVAQRRDWRASPLLAPSLAGLPPTLLVLAGFDPLHAQGETFASRLKKEGVTTAIRRFPGQMHGFVSHAKILPKAYEAIEELGTVLRANH